MSSLRNAVQRRNHRERAQPTERSKWGLLEKRKDYQLRAADHKTKKRKLAALKEKAATRNEDEFYFAMVNSSTDKGIKRAKRGEQNAAGSGSALPVDVVALMKTQDQAYLQTKLQQVKNAHARLKQEVTIAETGVGTKPVKGRIVFGDDGEELRDGGVSRNGRTDIEDDAEDGPGGWSLDDDDDDLSDDEIDAGAIDLSLPKSQLSPRARSLQSKRRRLIALAEQEKQLAAALRGVEQQRDRMSGKAGGVNKNGMRFKPPRR